MTSTDVQNRKTTFKIFLENNRIPNKLKNNPSLQAIFDILNTDDALITAVDASTSNKPALSANVAKIESYVIDNPSGGIDLTDDVTKQTIGIIQKAVLVPFGYVPSKSKRLNNSDFFTSAACYELTAPAQLKVLKIIAPI